MKEEVEEVTTVSTTQQPEHMVRTTKVIRPPVVSTEHPQKVFQKKKTIFRFYQVVWYILSLIEILLSFRFGLRALGADPASGFAALIYTLSDPFALPFQGIFRMSISGGKVIEWSTILAGLVYFLIAFGIVQLSQFIKPVSPEEVSHAVDET